MEEQIEKFGSGRKQKRQNNKKERGHIKNLLKNYEDFDENDDEDDMEYEEISYKN